MATKNKAHMNHVEILREIKEKKKSNEKPKFKAFPLSPKAKKERREARAKKRKEQILNPEPYKIKVSTITIKLTDYSNGSQELNIENHGFNAFEIIGICERVRVNTLVKLDTENLAKKN